MLKDLLSRWGVFAVTLLGLQVWTYRGLPPASALATTAVAFSLGVLLVTVLSAGVRRFMRYDEPDAGARPGGPGRQPHR